RTGMDQPFQPVRGSAGRERGVIRWVEGLAEGMLNHRFIINNEKGRHARIELSTSKNHALRSRDNAGVAMNSLLIMPGVRSLTSVMGKRTTNEAPPSGRLDPEIVPPCSSTIRFEITRPSPRPVSLPVAKGTNSRESKDSRIPGPVSVI